MNDKKLFSISMSHMLHGTYLYKKKIFCLTFQFNWVLYISVCYIWQPYTPAASPTEIFPLSVQPGGELQPSFWYRGSLQTP